MRYLIVIPIAVAALCVGFRDGRVIPGPNQVVASTPVPPPPATPMPSPPPSQKCPPNMMVCPK